MRLSSIVIVGASALLMLAGCANRDPNEVLATGAIPPSWQVHPENKSSFDVAPKLLNGHAPIYPISQLKQHKGGAATIAFTIDAQGKTRDFRVISADYPFFGSHAILAVQGWRFEPARKNGRPVEVHERVSFDYRVP